MKDIINTFVDQGKNLKNAVNLMLMTTENSLFANGEALKDQMQTTIANLEPFVIETLREIQVKKSDMPNFSHCFEVIFPKSEMESLIFNTNVNAPDLTSFSALEVQGKDFSKPNSDLLTQGNSFPALPGTNMLKNTENPLPRLNLLKTNNSPSFENNIARFTSPSFYEKGSSGIQNNTPTIIITPPSLQQSLYDKKTAFDLNDRRGSDTTQLKSLIPESKTFIKKRTLLQEPDQISFQNQIGRAHV